MAEQGGFGGGFGARREGGPPRRPRRPARQQDEPKEWMPVSKLGRLVKEGKIANIDEIYIHSYAIKEAEIIDFFFPTGTLVDEVMKIIPVQKQTRAGQRTRFKAFVAVGDGRGHVGLGVKCAKEVATAIRGGIIAAKLSLIPVRLGYWGSSRVGQPHTVPMKVSGKCGSVRVRLVPAPLGSQVVGAPTTKKMMGFAGIKDVFSSTAGRSRTRGNFMRALFIALSRTYGYLCPDVWVEQTLPVSLYQKHSDLLAQDQKKKEGLKKFQEVAVV